MLRYWRRAINRDTNSAYQQQDGSLWELNIRRMKTETGVHQWSNASLPVTDIYKARDSLARSAFVPITDSWLAGNNPRDLMEVGGSHDGTTDRDVPRVSRPFLPPFVRK